MGLWEQQFPLFGSQKTVVKDRRIFPASPSTGEDSQGVLTLCCKYRKGLLHPSTHVERKQLSYHALKLSFQVLKCTRVMYFPCQFAAVTDMSPNPISGYFLLKCWDELLNMFYKLAPPKKKKTNKTTQPSSVIRLHNSRRPMG